MIEANFTKNQVQSLELLCKRLGCKNLTELFSRLIEAASFLSRIEKSNVELIGLQKGGFELLTEAERADALIHIEDKTAIVNYTKDIREIANLSKEVETSKDLFTPIGDA